MEQKGVQLDRETFSCSICLDPLKDPVTLSCGHSYCMKCIKDHWDEEDRKRVYSCPQCRKTFTQRPVLEKSTVLTALVEELKKTGLEAAPDDHCYAGPEDVACDVCTGRKLKATKSCLVCRASYCEKHLQPHYDAATFKKHKLADPSKKLQENICSRHNEVMKIFCRTDRQIICSLCLMEEHKDHDTVSAAAERTEKQKELEGSRRNLQQRIKKQEKEELLLQQEVEDINASADEAVEHSEEIFTQMMRDVKQEIRSQQETQVSRVRELQEKLQQEVAELKRKDGELEKLSHTEDHEFLQSFSSLSALGESTHSSSSNTRPLTYFKEVTAAVSQTRDLLQDALRDGQTNISETVSEVDDLLSGPEPKTRDLLQDALRDGQTNISETVSEVDVLLSGPQPKTRDLLQDALRDGRTNISKTVSEVDVLLSGPQPKTRDLLQDALRDGRTNISETVSEVDVLLSGPEPKTRDLLQDALRDGRTNISETVNEVDVLLSGPEPKTRDLLQDALRDGRTNISKTVSEVDVLLSGPQPKTRDLLQDALRDGRTNISETVSEVDVLLSGPEPKTRDLLQDALRDRRTNISKTVSEVDVLLSGPEPKTRDLLQDALRDGRTNISKTVSGVDVLLSGPEPKTRDLLQDALRDGRTNISKTVSGVDVLLSGPEPKTRAEFLRYSREIILDPNTANRNLLLSEWNRKVTSVNQEQSYSDHPDRFTRWWFQVLSRESLTGRCYWEVERSGRGEVYLSVAYKNTSREERFGSDDKSWSLCCYPEGYRFYYNKVRTAVSGPLSSRVGVYLDHPAGILSFYSISGTMTLLHRVQTSFTQRLHAGLGLYYSGSTAEFIKVK